MYQGESAFIASKSRGSEMKEQQLAPEKPALRKQVGESYSGKSGARTGSLGKNDRLVIHEATETKELGQSSTTT